MLPLQHNPSLILGSCRWSTSCHSQVPSGCHVPGADPQRSRNWGPSSAAPGPWSWCSQRALPAPGTPLGPGGSLLRGTGWECAPGGGNEEGITSHADAWLPSTARAGEGTTHDHKTHQAVLLGSCNRVYPVPFHPAPGSATWLQAAVGMGMGALPRREPTRPRISPLGCALVLTCRKAVPWARCCSRSASRSFTTP